MNDEKYEIRNPTIEELLLNLGRKLKEQMPKGYGFTLMIFSFDGPEMFYLSSAERETMITAMKEFITKEDSSSKG